MKIVYLHQYFRTPSEGGAIRSYYLAKSLVDKGYEVEIITSHNDPKDKTVIIDGIKVHYLSVYYDNKQNFLERGKAFLSFVYRCYQKAKQIKTIDLVYATSTPLTIGWVALRLKKKLNIPYYFEVRDLWPEAPIQMGVIKNKILQRYLYNLEKKIYLNAQKIIALSPGMRDGVERSMQLEKPVYIIPNISDCDYFHPEAKNPILEDKYGVKGKFVVTYFGAIGKVNNLDFLIDAIRECKSRKIDKVHFLIAGKGGEVERMQKLIHEYQLTNTTYLGYLNKDGIKELLNVTDASYISFADKPVLETNSPNKFFDSIAAGKLCIVNTRGWIKEMIEQKECGFYTDPYVPVEFITKLEKFLEDRSTLLLYQSNARKLAEHHFSRAIQTERFVKLFDKEGKIDATLSSVYTLIA